MKTTVTSASPTASVATVVSVYARSRRKPRAEYREIFRRNGRRTWPLVLACHTLRSHESFLQPVSDSINKVEKVPGSKI